MYAPLLVLCITWCVLVALVVVVAPVLLGKCLPIAIHV